MSVHHYTLINENGRWVFFCENCRDTIPLTAADRKRLGV